MTYAVLAHREDTDAEPLARELALHSPDTALVWEDELFLGSRFTHRLDDDGIRTEILLAGGRRLDCALLRGLVCRLTHTLPAQFATAPDPDRDYAAMEAHALLLSWLTSLRCPVVNPPSPRRLGGPELGPMEWQPLAAASGLRGRRIRFASPRAELWAEPVGDAVARLLVVGDRVLGDAGEDAEGCLRLARRVACPVLGIWLAEPADGGGRRIFCGAETVPALGPEGAVAVAALLTGEAT